MNGKFKFAFEKLEIWQFEIRKRAEVLDRKLHGLINPLRGRG